MKSSKLLFFSTITIFGLVFAVFAVLAQSAETPTFEIDDASPTGGPVINSSLVVTPSTANQNDDVTVSVGVTDVSGVDSVFIKLVNSIDAVVGQVGLNDNGVAGDTTPGDGIYSGYFNIGYKTNGAYHIDVVMTDTLDHVNVVRNSSALTITGGTVYSCSTSADCGTSEKCCGTSCVIDNCTVNSDCVRCSAYDASGNCTSTENGTCDTGGCYNTCDYTTTPACTSNTDCVSPDNYCNLSDGTCMIAECLFDGDCTASAGGTCNTALVPPACEYPAVDTTPPSVAITEPLNTSVDPAQPFTTSTVIIKATATDENNISKVEFHDEDGNLRSEQFVIAPGYPDEYWATITFTNGTHQITATAYDDSNNTAQATVNLEFNLSSTAPIIDTFTANPTNIASSAQTAVNLVAHDDDSNIESMEIFSSKGGGAISTYTFTPAPTVTWNIGIGGSVIVDWGNAYDTYAEAEDSFKLPFIKTAEAATSTTTNGNCTTTTTTYDRYIYAMVADATNPATQSGNISMVISTSSTSCGGTTNVSTGGSS